jgi:hypothetical protein
MVDRFTCRNILKFLLLFKHKGLLYSPLFYLLKESLLSGCEDVPNCFKPYDLAALSEDSNLQHLQRLFDLLLEHAVALAKRQLDGLFTEENLVVAHQISNEQAIQEKQQQRPAGSIVRDAGVEGAGASGLIYGEVDFDSFQRILEVALTGLRPSSPPVHADAAVAGAVAARAGKLKFVDLGSGTGKACLWAALTTPVSHVMGIEVVEGLHLQALELYKRFCELNHHAGVHEATSQGETAAGTAPLLDGASCRVELVCGSFLADVHEWSDSDIAFANSTCFPNDLVMKLAVRSQLMRPGSRFVTFTVALDSPYWKVIYRERMLMSWGMATVFVQERLSDEEARRRLMSPDELELDLDSGGLGAARQQQQQQGGRARRADDGIWTMSACD